MAFVDFVSILSTHHANLFELREWNHPLLVTGNRVYSPSLLIGINLGCEHVDGVSAKSSYNTRVIEGPNDVYRAPLAPHRVIDGAIFNVRHSMQSPFENIGSL